MTCSCGHQPEQHDGPCAECRCPAVSTSTDPILTHINGRWPLYLPPHRAYRREWPWWEAARLAAMHHYLKPGDVLYDVGSEEGDLSALFASWGCRVVLTEPNSRVWSNIRACFEANNLTPLACWEGFVGSTVSNAESPSQALGHPIPVWWPKSSSGPVIHDHGFLTLWERPELPTITVDALVAWGVVHCPPVDALTIDVEGAELRVLEGARHTLETVRPLVFVSVHDSFLPQYGDTAEGLDAYMRSVGYEDTFLATDHERHVLWRPKERAL